MHRDHSGSAHPVSGQPDTTPRYWTVEEYAKLTRRCPESVRQRIRDGLIRAVRCGRRYLIPTNTVDDELQPTYVGAATACPDGDARSIPCTEGN